MRVGIAEARTPTMNRSTECPMTEIDIGAATRHVSRRTGRMLTACLMITAFGGWRPAYAGMPDMPDMKPAPLVVAAEPASYPAAGKEPQAKTEFPTGAAPISGAE